MGFTSVVSAYFPMFITVLNYRESGSYRDAEAGPLIQPAVLGVTRSTTNLDSVFLPHYQGTHT